MTIDALPSQVAKLVPLLSSNHDGEVLAAVRAIERKLKAEAKDWHWLAERIEQTDFYSSYVSAWKPSQPSQFRKPPQPKWDDIKRSEQMAWLNTLVHELWIPREQKEIVKYFQNRTHAGMMFDSNPSHKKIIMTLIDQAKEMGIHI